MVSHVSLVFQICSFVFRSGIYYVISGDSNHSTWVVGHPGNLPACAPPYCRGGILVLCYSWFSSVLVLGTVCIFVHLWPSFRLGNGLVCRLYPSLVSRSGAAVSQSTLLDRRVFWSDCSLRCFSELSAQDEHLSAPFLFVDSLTCPRSSFLSDDVLAIDPLVDLLG